MYIKVSFMYPWLPEGPLMTQWAPAVIRGPLVSWAPSRQGGPRVTWGPLREQVASWAKSWVRAWLEGCVKTPPRQHGAGYWWRGLGSEEDEST